MSNSIHSSVKITSDTKVGQYTVVLENVTIGKNCTIGHHVVIHEDTVIGDNSRIDDHAVLGKRPMKSAAMAITETNNLAPLEIGIGSLVGTGATLYRGSRIGSDTLIADYASVRENSTVGDKTIIGRAAVVENHVNVGSRCKIETGVFVAAFSEIGDGCFIAPEVTITNDNFMGRTEERKSQYEGITVADGGRIGANATILPGRAIGPDGVAAAGSLVTKDIPAKKIVAGIPAKAFREVPANQLLQNQ